MPHVDNRHKKVRSYELKPTSILLKDRLFRVNDISTEGIGIILEEKGPRFFIGERLEEIPLPLQSGPVTLKGFVTHISVTDSGTIYGIRFLFSGDDFNSIVQFKKERTHPLH